LRVAESIGSGLIGINNRDLHSFVTDLAVAEKLLAPYEGGALQAGALIVAESGIETAADIRRLYAAGARAFLIGESLLRGGAPRETLSGLVATLAAAPMAERAAAVRIR